MKIAIYPGSFDPITFGHIDIVERAASLFDKVILGVAESQSKNPLFSVDERIELISDIFKDNPKIEVIGYSKQLTVDLARDNNAIAIIRGLRAVADFEYDKLKISILDLEKKYKFLKSDKSPSLTVGFKPSKNFKKEIDDINKIL